MATNVFWLSRLFILLVVNDLRIHPRQAIAQPLTSNTPQMDMENNENIAVPLSNDPLRFRESSSKWKETFQFTNPEVIVETANDVSETSSFYQDDAYLASIGTSSNKPSRPVVKRFRQPSSIIHAAPSNSHQAKSDNVYKERQQTSKLSPSTSTSHFLSSTSSLTKLPRSHWRRPCRRFRATPNISFPGHHYNLSHFHFGSISPSFPAKQPHIPRAPYQTLHLDQPNPYTKQTKNKKDNKIRSNEENGIRKTQAHTGISPGSLSVDKRKQFELDENYIATPKSTDFHSGGKTIKLMRRKRAASHEKLKQIRKKQKRNDAFEMNLDENTKLFEHYKHLILGNSSYASVKNVTTISTFERSEAPRYHGDRNNISFHDNENPNHNGRDHHRYRTSHYHHRHRRHRRQRLRRQSTSTRRPRLGQRRGSPFGRNFATGRRPRLRPGASNSRAGTNVTDSVKLVSLKVVVHIGVRRNYQRVLESSIRNQARSLEFRMLQKYVRFSGSMVRLRNDKPKDILQAFCKNILTTDTTAVVHLMNPFYHFSNWDSTRYVASLLATLNIPRITWGPEYIGALDKKETDNTQLNISPTLHHQAHALIALLTHYKWPFFAVIYTNVPGYDSFLTSIRMALSDYNNPNNNSTNQKRQNRMDEEHRLELLTTVEMTNVSDQSQTHTDLKKVMKTDARVIILFCKDGETFDLLAEASKLGMLGTQYVWILTFEAINKNKDRSAKYLPVGLLGLQYNYGEAAMEKAIRTAVSVWFHGLKEAIMSTVNSSSPGTPKGFPWKLPNLQCQSNSTLEWHSGHEFYKFLRNVSINNVTFNDIGQLESTNISIFNVQSKGGRGNGKQWVEIGKWTKNGIFMKQITWAGDATTPPRGKPERHFLRIVTREEPPFVEYRDLNKNGSCDMFSSPCSIYTRDMNESRLSTSTIQKCCTGLSIEILRKLAFALDFEFHLYEVPDFQWGSKTSNGEWNGIVGELRAGNADMGVASMTIDEDKSGAINFSMPYMETGITFIVAIREGAVSATAFLEPYDYPSWCLILLCSVHVTGASIFLFEWLSPDGMDHGKKATTEHRFSLFRAFWLMWAMLFGAAVTTDTPRGVSSKFLSNIWALFALVFTASYTANLAAFMITKEEFYDLSGMQDWRLQNPYSMNPPFRFATVPNGTAESNIKKNNPWMYQYMSKYSQRSVEHAIEALKSHDLHAFIYDASVLKYQEGKDKDCQLITVGNWYATTGYGVSFPLGSPWLERVNRVILKLQYEGEMDRLKEFWLAGACHTKRKKNNNNRGIGNGVSSATLGILNFASAFIFLLAGTGLAAIVFAMEFCFFWFGRKKLSTWSNKDCCNLISLSMGMTLSFRDSVREAMEAHKKALAKQCKSAMCETKLWKANFDLRQARAEIGKLQSELERLNLQDKSIIAAAYEPIEYKRNDMAQDVQDTCRTHSNKDDCKGDAVNQPHCAEVHLNNGDVTNPDNQSNWPTCLLSDNDDDDEEASVRVTLL